MKSKFFIIVLSIFFISLVSASQICEVYDDFSSGVLDSEKWEIRQDVEGQSFTEEYGIIEEDEEFVFHIKQNSLGVIHGTYLFPKKQFTTGDILEYDYSILSKEGSYMSMVLLTGNNYIRVGINGFWSNSVQGYDELGISHIKIEFQENNFHLERTTPSNLTLIDNLPLTNSNGNYELYLGSGTGQDGRIHIDFDNFQLCSEIPEPNLDERISILESWKILIDNWKEELIQTLSQLTNSVDEHESRISSLEENSNSETNSYFKYLSSAERKNIICEYAKANNLTTYSDLGWNCIISLRLSPRWYPSETTKICNCRVV